MATPPCQLSTQSSVYYCTCKNPPVPCCQTCSFRHHETPGAHCWAAFEQPEKRNMSCLLCQERIAEFVCCCKFPVTPLCSECRYEHTKKDRVAMHIEQPTEKVDFIKSFGDIENARKVLGNSDRIEAYLNQNNAALSELKDEVTNLAEELKTRVNIAKDEAMKEISKTEREIEKKCRILKQTVEKYLFQGVSHSDVLLREAFDTSKLFACTEILRGEMSKDFHIGPCLAQLHLPPYLKAIFAEPQQDAQLPSYQSLSANLPLVSAQSLPLVRQEAPVIDHALSNLQVSQPQMKQFPSDFGSHQDSTQSVLHQPRAPQAIPPTNVLEVTEEMRNCVHAPCCENFSARTPEISNTIGRHRLPIESLKGEFKWNELMVRKIQLLADKYSSWRRSREDGNSFYRCFGVLLCEHYCRPDTPMAEVATIYKAMIEQALHFQMISNSPEILGGLKLWLRLLRDIYTTRTRGENAFQRLQYFLQSPQFDKAIIIAMRNYTATYFRLHASDPGISEFLPEGPEPVIREIMKYGTEAEGIALKFAAQAFNITLRILTFDNKSGITSEIAYGPAVKGWCASMHVLHFPGHYSYLVPRVLDAADHYDFASNTYNPVPSLTPVDYEEYVPT